MSHWPIRLRLTLWYALSLSGMLACFCGLIHHLMADRLEARTDQELIEEMQELRLEINLAQTPRELARQLQVHFGDHLFYQFAVLDMQGSPIFVSSGIPVLSLLPTMSLAGQKLHYQTISVPNGTYRVASQLTPGSHGLLQAFVLANLNDDLAVLRDLRTLLLAAGLPIIVIAVIGGYWLASRILYPVALMVRTARQIDAVHSRERLDVVNPNDELGQLALTLNAMIDRLQHSVEEQLQFTTDAAHELRTPLAVLRSTAELALRQPRDAEYYQERLRSIVDDTERLTQLSNQLLELAREDTMLSRSDFQIVDLTSLLKTLSEEMEPICEERTIHFVHQIEHELTVVGDHLGIYRVLMNLMDNAIQHTPPNGTIELAAETRVKNLIVAITDTGNGIPEEHREHVFRRFYRVDRSRDRRSGGAGLGLSLAQAIVRTHGGTISIRNHIPHGTIVEVSFPKHVRSQEMFVQNPL